MTFEDIYQRNLWRGTESLSGPGSGTPATRTVSAELAALVGELRVRTVLDFGCGDGYWMPDLPGYVGYDPTRRAIARAKLNHPDRRYTNRMPTRPFDMVIVRDVIQHLPLMAGVWTMTTAADLSRKYLVMSHYVNGNNRDIAEGEAYSPNMTSAPFNMPEPDRLIFDGHHYHDHGTDAVRDAGKFLAVWYA